MTNADKKLIMEFVELTNFDVQKMLNYAKSSILQIGTDLYGSEDKIAHSVGENLMDMYFTLPDYE